MCLNLRKPPGVCPFSPLDKPKERDPRLRTKISTPWTTAGVRRYFLAGETGDSLGLLAVAYLSRGGMVNLSSFLAPGPNQARVIRVGRGCEAGGFEEAQGNPERKGKQYPRGET